MKKIIDACHNANLTNLIKKAQYLDSLNGIVKKYLDYELGSRCYVANLRENCLIIEVESAAWATRLRYLIPQLLASLRQENGLNQLETIEFYVRPAHEPLSESHLQKNPLSEASAQMIAEIAADIEDVGLRTALEKLAKIKP